MSITFGDVGAPSDVNVYLDAVFSTSVPKYRKQLTDNIGENNAILKSIMGSDAYESYEGGTDIREPLVYALSPMSSYDGYDELADDVTDGITQAVYEARQLATPISYSSKEVIQNKLNILNLVKSKILQGEMGIQEGFAQNLMLGSGDAALETAKVNAGNGSRSINPISHLIQKDPTSNEGVGNINQSTSTWWRNVAKDSAASTYDGFMLELDNLANTCALGMGGKPNLFLMDQVTYELFVHAFWQKYRDTRSNPDWPFENTKFKGGMVVMDEKVPDVENNLTSAATKGTVFAANTKFLKLRYIPERNFEMLKNEEGKVFAKPIKGDSRLGHIAWMGELTTNNRRKHGVLYDVARTLT